MPVHPQGLVPALGGRLAPAPQPLPPEDGQWTKVAKDDANTRFSGLDEIRADNVGRLRPAWTWSTGSTRGHEAAPLVIGATMYVVTPFPNRLVAFDLRAPGRPKWTYAPPADVSAEGAACCDLVNRGAAYADGRLFFATLDGWAVGVDAGDGREAWRVRLTDYRRGESMTMAPLAVKGKVLFGNSGGEFGVRGWLTALDAATGTMAWRAYSTGPDAEVLIGPRFRPHYAQDRGKDLGKSTWPGEAWKLGGGTVWGFLSYDAQLDLVFHGTANPGAWNPEQRPGDNKWTAGVFARDPDDGQAVWFYQWSPHDLYDHDGVNENVLVNLALGGMLRQVLLHPDRNGHLYVLDRASGQMLSAAPFAFVNSSKGVDPRTGRLIPEVSKEPRTGQVVHEICPAAAGAKDWQPSAFSPRTGLLYVPHQNLCQDEEGVEANYIAGTPFVGANVRFYAGPGGHQGEFTAWDPVRARIVWQVHERFPVWSGALVTAGDVVFYGTMEGWFKAVDARTGKLLWRFQTGSGVVGQPISYRGPDGHQYVAVFSGIGGWPGAIVSGDLDPRDATAAGGWGGAMVDLAKFTKKGGTLYVFALPETQP